MSLNYILLGLFWILVCIGLGVYITAKGFEKNNHHTIGLASILVSFVVGIFMLFTILILF